MTNGYKKLFLYIFSATLLLLLGGVHRPTEKTIKESDPIRTEAASLITSPGKGSVSEWNKAAISNPAWMLQINAKIK